MRYGVYCDSDETASYYMSRNLNLVRPSCTVGALVFAGDDMIPQRPDDAFQDGDILEIQEGGRIRTICHQADDEVFIYVTGRCNSNCFMCPSPEWERRNGNAPSTDEIIELIRYYPRHINHFTITGGEPFLLKDDLFIILEHLKHDFPDAGYLVLTNGRGFCIPRYAEKMQQHAPKNTLIGIPLHSHHSQRHDALSGVDGSFEQTVTGIHNLIEKRMDLEIRIVVNKMNFMDIPGICSLISDTFPQIAIVTFMAMEMSGNAAVNRQHLWVPLSQTIPYIDSGAAELLKHGIDFRFYNFPLCTLPPRYWAIAHKSISEEKIRFAECCSGCKCRPKCGGFFRSSRVYIEKELRPYV